MLFLVVTERATFPIVGGLSYHDVPKWLLQVFSGIAGGSVALVFARVAYVVWKDVDIVEFQAEIITKVAAKETKDKVLTRGEGVRKAGVRDPRKRTPEL